MAALVDPTCFFLLAILSTATNRDKCLKYKQKSMKINETFQTAA
jgi:hypothetical protein